MREALRAVAALIAVTLLAYPFTITGLSRGYVALSVPAVLFVLSGLLLWSEGAVTVSAAALVFPYVVVLAAEDRPVDVLAPVAAALLVCYVVIADTAISVPPSTALDAAFLRDLAARCAGVIVLALALGAVLLAVSALPLPDSQVARSLGIGAAALALGAPVWLLTAGQPRKTRRKRFRARP
ncbi:MAG TPA: hypothetical protein VNA12_07900 [Mycobacteriales bacterium]|nr:hypothetical protein [Mycobacteriales bacterium]